jgi:hypothetical protein
MFAMALYHNIPYHDRQSFNLDKTVHHLLNNFKVYAEEQRTVQTMIKGKESVRWFTGQIDISFIRGYQFVLTNRRHLMCLNYNRG